jgi:hypothetical protein
VVSTLLAQDGYIKPIRGMLILLRAEAVASIMASRERLRAALLRFPDRQTVPCILQEGVAGRVLMLFLALAWLEAGRGGISAVQEGVIQAVQIKVGQVDVQAYMELQG